MALTGPARLRRWMLAMLLDVLVIAPHPDDAELGMGGAIVKLICEGKKVGVLDLTNGEPTPHGSVEIRARETAAATKVLGLKWRENLGLPNRSLEATLENRAKLAAVIRRTRPRWLFAPYWDDAHPDHTAATKLVDDARFWAKLTKTDLAGEPHHPERIYNYYCIHLKAAPQPAFVLDITEEWEAKLASVRAYESQFLTGRDGTFFDRIRDEASFWGKTIGRPYGEPFNCREPIGLGTMEGLV
jgi:bacillithiol biosynthesis deacetylase BshB1